MAVNAAISLQRKLSGVFSLFFRCLERPSSTLGMISARRACRAWQRPWSTDTNFFMAELRIFFTLSLKSSVCSLWRRIHLCTAVGRTVSERTGYGFQWGRASDCPIVTVCLFFKKTSWLMLSLAIHQYLDWCHDYTKQHFVKQLEKFAYKGER